MNTDRQQSERSLWAVLAGAGTLFLILGSLAALWMPRAMRRREPGMADRLREVGSTARRHDFGRDFGRARQTTTHGLGAGLSTIWDTVMGGTEAVRTQTRSVPRSVTNVTGSISHAQRSLGNTVDRFRRSTFSFIATTIWALVWISIAGFVLLFVYMPEPSRREHFFERGRQMYQQVRGMFG